MITSASSLIPRMNDLRCGDGSGSPGRAPSRTACMVALAAGAIHRYRGQARYRPTAGTAPRWDRLLAVDRHRLHPVQSVQILAYRTTGAVIILTFAVVPVIEIITNWVRKHLI
jgi:hypothetical protein